MRSHFVFLIKVSSDPVRVLYIAYCEGLGPGLGKTTVYYMRPPARSVAIAISNTDFFIQSLRCLL